MFLVMMVVLFSVGAYAADTATPSANPAVVPVPRSDDWWVQRHAAILERVKQGNVDLIFIGDSITHGWEGTGEIWEKYYAPRKAVNLGYSGDQTQHVLWRLDHGEVDGISPKLAVIMIGTNNSNGDEYTAEQIADGIIAIVEKLQIKLPGTKVLVLGIFPRAEKPCPQRAKNAKASELAAKYIADRTTKGDKNLFYLDIGPKFLAADGTLPADIMPDFLHPNAKGYQIWAEAVESKIDELMGGK